MNSMMSDKELKGITKYYESLKECGPYAVNGDFILEAAHYLQDVGSLLPHIQAQAKRIESLEGENKRLNGNIDYAVDMSKKPLEAENKRLRDVLNDSCDAVESLVDAWVTLLLDEEELTEERKSKLTNDLFEARNAEASFREALKQGDQS